MSIIKEYRCSIKDASAEEYVDLLFYRPVAFGVVKLFSRAPISPNQVSLMALIAGCVTGYCFTLGTELGFALGAVSYGLFAVLDCADGMLARLTGKGSEFGRVIDGVVDHLVTIIVYFSFAVGLSRAGVTYPSSIWTLTGLALLSALLHGLIFDYYLTHYLANSSGKTSFLQAEISKHSSSSRDLSGDSGTKLFYQLLSQVYIFYCQTQVFGERIGQALRFGRSRPEEKTTLKYLRLMGPDSHVTVLWLAAAFFSPALFFFYAIVLANIWVLLVCLRHARSARPARSAPVKKKSAAC